MPHPIIEISELAQAIVDHLLPYDKRSLVSLACTCRALKEQALSTLWSEQSSLVILIKSSLPPGVLPPSELPPQVHRVWQFLRSSLSLMGLSSLQASSGTSSDDMDPGCVGSTCIGTPETWKGPSA